MHDLIFPTVEIDIEKVAKTRLKFTSEYGIGSDWNVLSRSVHESLIP